MEYQHISVEVRGDVGIIRLLDSLLNDGIVARAMEEELLSVPVDYPDVPFVVDMSNVEKIGFPGCYALVELQRDHLKIPGGMPLVEPLLAVQEELRRHGFLLNDTRTMFRTFWSLDVALAMVRPVLEGAAA